MQSTPNLNMGKKHINFSFRKTRIGPIFFFPAFWRMPIHDVNLDIEGSSWGVSFLSWIFQINIRRKLYLEREKKVDITIAAQLSQKISSTTNFSIDPGSVLSVFDKHKFMREIAAKDALFSPYTLRLIREIAKEDEKRGNYSQNGQMPDIQDIEQQLL